MSKITPPLFVVFSVDGMERSQVENLNDLTRELAQSLQGRSDAVDSVTFGQKSDLLQGTKVAGEIIFAEQMLLTVVPLMVPWVLGKIDAAVKLYSSRRNKQVKAKVIVGNSEIQITPQTTSYELNKSAQQIKAVSELAPNRRFALVIGNSHYLDERLSNLNSSIVDAERFAEILADPKIGSFDHVETIINKNNDEIKQAIEGFFNKKNRDDLLLLYYSGHGIKSPSGQLFLAAQNTSSDFLKSTGVSASFIKENMGESTSQRQVLILDCCYGGAVLEGTKSENFVGQTVNSILSFQPSGYGKIIITASESMQYAFDGQHVEGQPQNSAFTKHLIEGLWTGNADTDNDGLIDIDELYQYIYRQVVPQQTPNMSSTAQEGRMFIGLNPNPTFQSEALPEHIQEAMHSETRLHRQGAVSELIRLLKSEDPSLTFSAETALRTMTNDDSKSVADLAREALDQHHRMVVNEQTPQVQQTGKTKSGDASSAATPLPPITSTHLNVPPRVESLPSRPMMKETLTGFLNVILPGIAYAQTNQWMAAAITFILASIFTVVMLIFTFMSLAVCTIPLEMGLFIYLFFQGRNIARKFNQQSRLA
jgi:uncharacterized caspase-like protein